MQVGPAGPVGGLDIQVDVDAVDAVAVIADMNREHLT